MDIKSVLGILNTLLGILKKIFETIGIDSLAGMF